MPFDPKCMDLAEHFLPAAASEQVRCWLAQRIQDEIEDFLDTELPSVADYTLKTPCAMTDAPTDPRPIGTLTDE